MAAGRTPGSVAVLGGGMAGLSAALAAAQAGAPVTLLEAGDCPGGSARWSSGRIWTLPDYDNLRARCPLGDAALQRTLADGIVPALDWLVACVGHLGAQPDGKSGMGRLMQLGRTGDRGAWFDTFAGAVAAAGVTIRYGVSVDSVRRAADGGFRLVGAAGEVTAAALVVATGGFQGDRQALATWVGPESARLMLRSNPHSRGAGLRIGTALGGATSRGMGLFYGKSVPPGGDELEPARFKALTYDVARDAVAVNIEGRRFVDETAGISSEAIANAGLLQPGSRYLLLLDGSQAGAIDMNILADYAAATGQHLDDLVLEAETLEALGAVVAGRWGVDASRLADTVAAFNAASAGELHQLHPPRCGRHQGLRTGPFRALLCRPAITQSLGGLRVDADMALCDLGGRPVPGVRVAGADAGGVYVGAYAGGLAWALVSGRVAGLAAAVALAAARRIDK